MSVTAEMFRHGMRRLGGAVNIVTTADGDKWSGLTATAVTSLSAEPPKLLACINRDGMSYDTLSKGRTLAVNVLGVEHKLLAMQFAGMNNLAEDKRFGDDIWFQAETGAPLLKGALASFDCEVDSILDAGSHAIVIGLIKHIVLTKQVNNAPLCYLDGNWSTMTILSD